MRKRVIFWFVLLLLAAGAYVYFFTNWRAKKGITIIASLRPPSAVGIRAGSRSLFPVLFQLDHDYKLTSLKAVEVFTNNANAPEHMLWHLVATNGSNPVKLFLYGQNIQGMAPYLKDVRPEPLTTNVMYRLELTAGELKGSALFHTKEMPQ